MAKATFFLYFSYVALVVYSISLPTTELDLPSLEISNSSISPDLVNVFGIRSVDPGRCSKTEPCADKSCCNGIT
jgi:hypothetical protein